MTNDNQTNDILPIDANATQHAFNEVSADLEHLKTTITRLADYSTFLGLPDTETAKRITSAIINLIAATAEATHKLHHHQTRRKEPTTTNQPSSTSPNQNAPERTEHDTTNDPPSTDNLDKLDRQLQKQNE